MLEKSVSLLFLPHHVQLLVQSTDIAADRCHVAPVGSSVGAFYQKLYIQSKSAPEDGRICHPKHLGWIKKINKRKSCCILLVAYIVVSNEWVGLLTSSGKKLSATWGLVVKFTPLYPFHKRLGSLHFGRVLREENPFHAAEFETRTFQPVANRYADLSKLTPPVSKSTWSDPS